MSRLLALAAPPLLVSIWSTGFVAARAIKGEVDPDLFLTARLALTGLMFLALALAARVAWPRGRALGRQALAGALMSGVYFVGTYESVAHGLPAAVMALIGSLQPLLVALGAGPMLGEAVSRRTWAGLLVGLAGVGLVLLPRLAGLGGTGVFSPLVLGCAFAGVLGLTGGTLIQKQGAGTDLRAASAVQNFAGGAVTAVAALALGETHWAAGPAPLATLAWAVFGLSGLGTTLLIWMVRNGEATRASALLLLSPPLVAVQTYFLFGEALTPVQMLGFAVALLGVRLART